MNTSKADLLVNSVAVVAVLFGLLTVFSGGRTLNGAAYEARTISAMALRTLLWTGIAGTAYRALQHRI